jgi:PE-PPE domain
MRRDRRCRRYLTIALFGCAATALMPTANARADDADDPLNALMMGGTTMPTPSIEWQDRIIAAYVDPATGANYTPVLVPTPESEAYSSVPVVGLDIPAIGSAFNGAMPTDAGISTIDVTNQYDGFADIPEFPINPIADLNALLGIAYAHGAYGSGIFPQELPFMWPPTCLHQPAWATDRTPTNTYWAQPRSFSRSTAIRRSTSSRPPIYRC